MKAQRKQTQKQLTEQLYKLVHLLHQRIEALEVSNNNDKK